jgi:molybdopterin/thiamine biosynthesis adenylyltransferase
VDRDRVTAENCENQDYSRSDIGRFKAEALADRLRSQFPGLTVEGIAADLEDLPLGFFQVQVLAGALDSRRARQALVSEIGWPLGIPVVDGGVGEGLVGRVQVFVPGETTACLECTWSSEDYRFLAAEYPCTPGAAATAPGAGRMLVYSQNAITILLSASRIRLIRFGL